MLVRVGSTNTTRIEAVREAIAVCPLFAGAEVTGIEVTAEKFGHPVTLPIVVRGAMDRALQAFHDCAFSFGIEGGLMEVPHTNSGYMEIGACAIYDGKEYFLGLSPAHEWPKEVTNLIVHGGMDGSQALKAAGFTTHEKIGTVGGGISIFTNGRMTRKEYNRLAVAMALVRLENKSKF